MACKNRAFVSTRVEAAKLLPSSVTIRFLKNIMGMWLVQGCRRSIALHPGGGGLGGGALTSYDELVILANQAPAFRSLINPDDDSFVLPEYSQIQFRRIDIDRDDLKELGEYDLVIFSNVFEHLSKPDRVLSSIGSLLSNRGSFYLSWTPWYSPWGGHEFSPFHYLGARFGYSFYTRILKKPSQHVPYQNLFPTYIGRTLRRIRNESNLRIVQIAPRYYPECSFLMHIPIVREFLAWNCAMLIKRRS